MDEVERRLAHVEESAAKRVDEQPLAAATRVIAKDFTDLVGLRIERAKLDMYRHIDDRANDFARKGIAVGVGGVAGLFLLVAAALGIGFAIGHFAWGFVVLGALLAIAAGVLGLAHPRLMRLLPSKAKIEAKKLESIAHRGRPLVESPS